MKICFSSDEKRNVTAVITGSIGIPECALFREEVQKAGLDSAQSLTLDLSGVPYVTSSGLREFLTLKKRMGQRPFRLTGICGEVYQVLEMTGFSAIMDCERAPAKPVDYSAMSFRDFLAYKAQSGNTKIMIQDRLHKCTWADIDRGASNIAADLAKMGVGKGTHVAICSANSVNWLLTFFAVQKLGGIAILINYKAELASICDIADSADVTCFCYGEVLSAKDPADLVSVLTAPGSKIQNIYDMRADRDFLSAVPETALPIQNEVAPDDVALMIFTSGSTGRPKAVMLTAYNLLTSAENIAKSIDMSSEDTACVVSPMFHISGIGGGTFTNLIADARIVLPTSAKPDVILNVIEQEKCTVFNCVPTVMLALINHPDFKPERVQSLRYSKLSGAPITKAQFMEITEKTGHVHLAASYGMTEIAPITSTLYGDTIEHITETVGKPVEGVQVRVVNPTTRVDCPLGVSGEILAQGNNLL
ncbi:MAG: AMP-binding protein, partial [Clostridia bacterium]|nr:AMP-binding protein [Clostridia bacterium]